MRIENGILVKIEDDDIIDGRFEVSEGVTKIAE